MRLLLKKGFPVFIVQHLISFGDNLLIILIYTQNPSVEFAGIIAQNTKTWPRPSSFTEASIFAILLRQRLRRNQLRRTSRRTSRWREITNKKPLAVQGANKGQTPAGYTASLFRYGLCLCGLCYFCRCRLNAIDII